MVLHLKLGGLEEKDSWLSPSQPGFKSLLSFQTFFFFFLDLAKISQKPEVEIRDTTSFFE